MLTLLKVEHIHQSGINVVAVTKIPRSIASNGIESIPSAQLAKTVDTFQRYMLTGGDDGNICLARYRYEKTVQLEVVFSKLATEPAHTAQVSGIT